MALRRSGGLVLATLAALATLLLPAPAVARAVSSAGAAAATTVGSTGVAGPSGSGVQVGRRTSRDEAARLARPAGGTSTTDVRAPSHGAAAAAHSAGAVGAATLPGALHAGEALLPGARLGDLRARPAVAVAATRSSRGPPTV